MFSNFIIFFTSLFLFISRSQFPKVLWTYWEPGLQTQPYLQIFDEHHRKMIEKDGWEVRNLNKSSALEYLRQVPLFSQQQYNKIDETLTFKHRSGYVQCLIMSHYGGVYLDLMTLIGEDVAWLKFENLRKNLDTQNKYGDSPDLLFFTKSEYENTSTYTDPLTNKTYLEYPGYELRSYAAVPKSPFLVQLCPQLIQAYLNGWTSKEGYEKHIQNIIDEQGIKQGSELKNNPDLVQLNLIQIQLQRKQRKLRNTVKDKSNSSQPLAVHYYKIWHIQSQVGPNSLSSLDPNLQFRYLAVYKKEEISKILGIEMKYFIKLPQETNDIILSYYKPLAPFDDVRRKLHCYIFKEYCTVYSESFLYSIFIKDSKFIDQLNIQLENYPRRLFPILVHQTAIYRCFYVMIALIILLLCGIMKQMKSILFQSQKLRKYLAQQKYQIIEGQEKTSSIISS